MNVCIVGHGGSLAGKGMGPAIDAADVVVQLHPVWNLAPEDFGARADIVVFSQLFSQEGILERPFAKAPGEFWGLRPDLAYAPLSDIGGAPVIGFLAAEVFWTERLHLLGGRHPRGPDFDPPDLTRGLRAVACAAERFPGEPIVLAGFDNCLSGDTEGVVSVESGTPRREPANHDYATERLILAEMARHYRIDISPLTKE